jgi:hypothetical protein
MDTISETDVRLLRTVLDLLSAGSTLVHGALCVYCALEAVRAPPTCHSASSSTTRASA